MDEIFVLLEVVSAIVVYYINTSAFSYFFEGLATGSDESKLVNSTRTNTSFHFY